MSKKPTKTRFIDIRNLLEIIKDIIAIITLAKLVYSFLKYARTHWQTFTSIFYVIDMAIKNARIFDAFFNLEVGFSLNENDHSEAERIVSIFGLMHYHIIKKKSIAELTFELGKYVRRFDLTRFRSSSFLLSRYIFDLLDNWHPNYPLPIENFFGVED